MALLALIAFFFLPSQQPKAISRLYVAITLPAILTGPFVGLLIDRWNRKKVLIVCDSVRMILVLFIPWIMLWTRKIGFVYILVFLVFLFTFFFNTARLSIIPNLVSKKRLLAANSFVNIIGRVATLVGIVAGGMIVDWKLWSKIGIPGFSSGFYLDSLTYLVSLIAILTITIKLKEKEKPVKIEEYSLFQQLKREAKRVYQDFKEAYYLIRGNPRVQLPIVSYTLLATLFACLLVLFVPIVQSDLKLGTHGVGFIGGVGSIGLILSAFLFGMLGHRIRKEWVILGGFLMIGIFLSLGAFVKSVALLLPLAFIVGMVASPVMIVQDTLLHETVPEEIRGRIFSVKEWVMQVNLALSAFVVGLLTSFFSKRGLLCVIGVIVILLSLLGTIFWRKVE